MANKAEFKQDLGRTVNLNYLAQLHCSMNEFEQAEKMYKEALDIYSSGTNENDSLCVLDPGAPYVMPEPQPNLPTPKPSATRFM